MITCSPNSNIRDSKISGNKKGSKRKRRKVKGRRRRHKRRRRGRRFCLVKEDFNTFSRI